MERRKYSEGKNMIIDNLARFQSNIHPDGTLQIEGFWQRIAQESPEDSPVIGPLEQKLFAIYPSLTEANQAALAFPAFPALATQFPTAPFTTIADLLWELRQTQEDDAQNRPPPVTTEPIEEVSFEGAP